MYLERVIVMNAWSIATPIIAAPTPRGARVYCQEGKKEKRLSWDSNPGSPAAKARTIEFVASVY